MIIDYSQYSLFNFCPWAWYERYVNQRSREWHGQRRDPLCLGSLVHNALDNFAKTGKPSIDQAAIIENNPTPETLEMGYLLVNGYLRKYPGELWPVERAEQPLRFALDNCLRDDPNRIDGLAKLDGYFYVPEDTAIESGIPGEPLTLARGWWAKEYKTKASGRKRSEWIKEWQTKRQADFQILALGHTLNTQVQGVLVCVLEKPHEYIPKRKCSGCKNDFELASFAEKSDGFACPICGHVQKLSPYKPKSPKIPEYFRIIATRNPTQLEVAKNEILRTALRMEAMRSGGMEVEIPNRDACVNNVHRNECEYLGPHTYGGATSDSGNGFVTIDSTKYMGLVQ